ncbi:helix-turn-helix transcriptional regulator [Micromonospora sp. NPDC049230]|uniref:helix-turn-helix domain-containing protein n=1 Tax=Micromonospora sp. NPDC049230 TaxID=3155502 RepID=UPI0033D6599D
MTDRHPRGVEQRRALGRQLRAHRQASDLTLRQVKDHVGTGKPQMQALETGTQDVLLGTAIDIAAVYGLHLVLAGDHHLPLLNLSSAEVATLLTAALTALPDGDVRDRLVAALQGTPESA